MSLMYILQNGHKIKSKYKKIKLALNQIKKFGFISNPKKHYSKKKKHSFFLLFFYGNTQQICIISPLLNQKFIL